MNMKDRYDGNPGKEANIANTRQSRLEAQHSGKNQFVKNEQASVRKYAGKKPMMDGSMFEFNANMQNNGAWAQDFGKKLTEGLDKVAFPVNGQGDDS
jgi:hypothetical protein